MMDAPARTAEQAFETWWLTPGQDDMNRLATPYSAAKHAFLAAFTQGQVVGAEQERERLLPLVRQVVVDEIPGADTTLEHILNVFRTTPHVSPTQEVP